MSLSRAIAARERRHLSGYTIPRVIRPVPFSSGDTIPIGGQSGHVPDSKIRHDGEQVPGLRRRFRHFFVLFVRFVVENMARAEEPIMPGTQRGKGFVPAELPSPSVDRTARMR